MFHSGLKKGVKCSYGGGYVVEIFEREEDEYGTKVRFLLMPISDDAVFAWKTNKWTDWFNLSKAPKVGRVRYN